MTEILTTYGSVIITILIVGLTLLPRSAGGRH